MTTGQAALSRALMMFDLQFHCINVICLQNKYVIQRHFNNDVNAEKYKNIKNKVWVGEIHGVEG